MDATQDEPKALVEQYWNRRAETYENDSQHAIHSEAQHDAWLSVLREWTGESQQVLDVGCGPGVVSLLLAELDHDVTGIDYAPEMVERARANAADVEATLQFQQGDAESLAFPADSFDVVTARHLVWTLPNPEAAIREWMRVLCPGGHLVLIEGHWDFDEPWDEYEVIHEDLPLYEGPFSDQMEVFLRENGLENVASEPLTDAVFWGNDVENERYIVGGDVPGKWAVLNRCKALDFTVSRPA